MMFTNVFIHFVVGLIGGNATCESAPRFSLGPWGNTLVGGIGGVLGGAIFPLLVTLNMNTAGAGIQMMIGQIAAAGLCGTALTCGIGALRNLILHRHIPPSHLPQI
ncbi:MAG TPA: hypothetical protein VL026_01425 [Rhizomicrobium sp.]|nr:hypothetical protein [Rhizomicrobium sp.]